MEAQAYNGDDPKHCVTLIFNPEETEVVKAVYEYAVEAGIKSGIKFKSGDFEWDVANWPHPTMAINTHSVNMIAEPFQDYHRYTRIEARRRYFRDNPQGLEGVPALFALGRRALALSRQIILEGGLLQLNYDINRLDSSF